ncbi:hypothetical protein VDGD_04177 [Verticillium dahliae]|nr:hypothetical protein VDGD_04177 [Verticillium dahliae]
MARIRTRTVFLACLLASAKAASIPSIFQRDDQAVCGGKNLFQCSSGVDDGLCCKTGDTCIYLAGGSTVLCCPAATCNRIMPIQCNVAAQNPANFPNAPLKTTALRAELPKCGDNCCPFGFTCNSDGQCDMDENQSERPSERPASEISSTTVAPTSTLPSPSIITSTPEPTATSATATSSSTTTPTAGAEEQQQDNNNSSEDDKKSFPTAGVVVGVLGGVLVLIGVAAGVFMCLSRRRRNHSRASPSSPSRPFSSEKKHSALRRAASSTSSFGNFISEPIPNDASALRTDFILKTPSTAGANNTTTAKRASQRLSALFRRDAPSGSGGATAMVANPRSPPRIPARTLSNATMTTSDPRAALYIPPIRTMRNQQRPVIQTGSAWARGPAARVAAVLATTPTEPAVPVTPRLQREPSGECINIFADPGTVGGGNGDRLMPGGLLPPRAKRNTSATTFTELMEEAQLGDVRRGDPFVPRTPGRV